MADYREISQHYAEGAIKAVILLNGGAAVALLSQIGSLVATPLAGAIRLPMALWAIGTAIGGAVWILGFLSARHVDKSEKEPGRKAANLAISNGYMYVGIAGLIVALGCFLAGCIYLACQAQLPA